MADNLTTATIDVRANTRGLEKDILKALKTVEFSEINTKKSSQALGRITGQVSEFNKSLEASNARVIAFGASAGAIFAVEKAFSSLISSTIQVEKKLTDINVLLGLSAPTLQKFGDSLFGVAKNTAQSFSDVADAATELARQGLGIEETLKRTNAALILTRLSGLDAKSSVEALTATLNSFSSSALDAVDVVNKLANVDAAFAVSSADLANAITRVGSTAVDAGVSLDELIALVTSAQQTTARGGAVIGNSFKTIFTRLQRGKVQDLLGTLGVDTTEGQSAISLLKQLAATYDTLGAAQKSYVAEQVGGVFQINILKAALSDLGKEYSIYSRALETSLGSTDQAIRRNELLNKTVSALSSQAYANLEQAASKIGSLVFEPNAKGFLSGINDLLSAFNNIDTESAGGKLMEGFFKGVGDFIGGPGAVLATAVLVKLFSRLTQFAAGSAKELLGTNKAAQQQAAIEQSILSILQKNSQFTSQILSGKMTTVQAEKELLNYLTAQSNILREQEKLSKIIGTNLRMAGVSVGASGIPMVAAAGKGKKATASGYVPNFATDQAIGQAMENAGAKEHGYKAGKARKTRIHDGNGKSFKSFVNSKEDVKTFTNAAGKKATVVRPPNGFGKNTEYAAGGFVPNFAEKRIASVFKTGSSLRNLYDVGPVFDMYNDSAILKYQSLPKKYEEYRREGRFIFEEARKVYNNSGNDIQKANAYIAKRIPGGFTKKLNRDYFDKPFSENAINPIVGALGERDFFSSNPEFSKLEDYIGPDFKKGDLFAEVKILQKKISEKKLLEKTLRGIAYSSSKKTFKNEERDVVSPNLIFASAIKESFSSGFIPNFATPKASDRMTQMVMEKFYGITDPKKFKELYDIQSFKPAALKALYRERVEGATPSTDLSARAAAVNKISSDKAASAKVKDLGKIDYTMIHASEGGRPLSEPVVSYKKKDKKTGEETKYIAKMYSASLDNKKLNNASVQKRVGDALVDESNKLSSIFNPNGGAPFSDYKQLSNSGSVLSAAGTVFESAVRQAFKVPAQGQTARIDFPNPSTQLRSFFNNAPGDYEAKISDTQDNLSSALSKYIAVRGLANGYVPSFAKSSGLSFSQTKTDEFGFKELRAAIGGKNVGAFSYAEDKRGEIEIGDFTVDKKHRGKGYGTALYQEAIKRNKGKKMRGQLLPQMNRLLEKIKKGEPVSAETLYPQIKRADLAKDSVFEVYGHKGMAVEKMTRDQFSSFVNAKINELKKDPKRLQSYFGNVEADEYGGLGIGLTTQHSSGFIPNFLDVTKGKLPIGVRGRTNYGSAGSKTNIQLGVGAEESTLAHELFHSAYSRSTFDKAKSNNKIGKFISSPRQYAGSGALIGDQVFKNLNKNNLIKSVGLNPIQLDFDGKNPSASYSGEKAIDEIITRVQEKIFKNKGNLEALSADEKTFAENLQRLGVISNKRLSNVSRHSKEGSRFRSLVENKFSSIASSGFVPNFASQGLIAEINKRILNPNIAQKLKEGQGLKDEAYIKAASRLGVNIAGLDKFLPQMGFPLKGKDKVLNLGKALNEKWFARSFNIDAIKMGDWDYVKSSFEQHGYSKDDFDKLTKFANTERGDKALRWWKIKESKASGYIPNFANITSSSRDVRKKAHANQSSLNTFRVVHPLKPKIDAQGRVSFPDLEKTKGSVRIIHNEGMDGQNIFTLPSFLDFVNSRGNKEIFFRRNSFDYILNSAGYVPNFADALNNAINREQAAGLSRSQIYVDSHSSLKNKNNPMGLMVANTRDEPNGGIQGVKRAKKEGRNPKTYGGGMSSGFVPNFAFLGRTEAESSEIKSLQSELKKIDSEIANRKAEIKSRQKELAALRNDLKKGAGDAEAVKQTTDLENENKGYKQAKLKNPQLSAGLDSKIDENNKKIADIRNQQAEAIKKEIKSVLDINKQNRDLLAEKIKESDIVRQNLSTKKKETSKFGKAKNFVGSNAMSIGFGLQAAAGSIGEMAGGESTKAGRRTGAIASMAGDIAGFAGTGAMIAGPYGALAGALVGAVKGATNLAKVWNSKVPDLEAALQASSDSLNRFGESGQKILQLNEQYADALTSGGDPAKAADIMAKTQEAYAEELSKLTDTQRASMISAIAQGKGQEEYAKILKQLSDKTKGDDGADNLAKFREEGDKKILKGLDSDFAAMFSRGLDDAEIRTAIDVYSYSGDNKNTEYGKEQSALAVLNRLAASEKFSQDERDNLNNILNEFKTTSEETDSSDLAEGILKGLEKILKGRADSKKNAEAVKKDTENKKKKEQQELALKEAANARLLKIQAETESIFRKFNDGLDNFIGALEAGSKMREAGGNFKAEYLEQSGANSYIVDKQKEKNLVSSNQDSLAIADLKNKKESFNQFNAAIDNMLSGITADAAKKGIQQTDLEQQNALIDTKLSLQNQLYGASAQVLSGDTDGAKATIDKVFENLTPEAKSQIDPGAIVKGIQELKNVADQSNKNSRDLVNNSRRDLGIQAQQLIFQKAMSKLNQAQNYGGSGIKDIIKDDPENAFNRAISALNDAKILGYNQKDLKQGKESAVNGSWQGKEKTTWGINGEKPNPAMSGAVIDFYKAAGEISGESVLSTDSKDFGALTQAVSESIRKKLNELKTAGDGVVDPAVFTRMESTLQNLGGSDKVSQLKIMKELGYANISGKKIMDEAMKGYSGGALEGMDPDLKAAYKATDDEGTAATLMMVAGQKKQTDSLLAGMQDVTANATLKTNELLSQQPQAIADALSTILEKGKKQIEKDALDSSSTNLGLEIGDIDKSLESEKKNRSDAWNEVDKLEREKDRWINATETFSGKTLGNNEKMLDQNSPEMEEAKRITKKSKATYKLENRDDPSAGSKYNQMKKLVEMGEKFQNLKTKKDEVAKYDASIKSQEEKKKKLEGDKSIIDTKSANLASAIEKVTSSATLPSSPNSSGQISALSSSIRKGVEDGVQSGKESFGVGSSTERQLDAIKKSSSNYKITSSDGVQRTIERDAMYKAGVSPVNQGSLGKDTRLKGLHEAFQDIDSRNALPSYDNFKDVYSDLGGGEKEGGQMYENKSAEKFGGSMPVDEAVKKGVQDAASKASPAAAEKKPGLGFLDWAKKEGKVPQDFQLTKEMKTGEQALPESVAKAKQEFLSSFGAKTSGGGSIASTTADKGRLVSAVKQTEADESSRKYFAEKEAAIEATKPTWTGSRDVPDGKGGFKKIAAPKQGQESIDQANYETAKANLASEKIAYSKTRNAAPASNVEAAIKEGPASNVETAIKEGVQDAASKASPAAAEKKPGLGFLDWAKKEGKVPQDFQLTKEMKTGEQALPESVAKAKQEFLSSFGAKTSGGGSIASTTADKGRLVSAVKQTEADESSRKYFAEKEAAIEATKPTWTGSRDVPDGKGGFKKIAAPKQGQESIDQANYETAKANLASEKIAYSKTRNAAPASNVEAAIQGKQSPYGASAPASPAKSSPAQTQTSNLVEKITSGMARKIETQDNKNASPEQDPSQQILNSILASVNQIAQQIATSTQQGGQQSAQGSVTGAPSGSQSSSSGSAGSSGGVSVTAPVSLTVNTSAAQGTDAATAIAEQIKTGLSSFLSSPEFIGKVTSIANQAAGKVTPPTPPQK